MIRNFIKIESAAFFLDNIEEKQHLDQSLFETI